MGCAKRKKTNGNGPKGRRRRRRPRASQAEFQPSETSETSAKSIESGQSGSPTPRATPAPLAHQPLATDASLSRGTRDLPSQVGQWLEALPTEFEENQSQSPISHRERSTASPPYFELPNSPEKSTGDFSLGKQSPTSRKEGKGKERQQQLQPADASTEAASSSPSSTDSMASQQGKWREEQVLVICPGSLTTMAQLGCAELTPPTHRIPTRMFQDPQTKEYTPYRIYKRKKTDAPEGASGDQSDDEWEYVEDRDSVEGAIYPLKAGCIVNMDAFLAFIDYVHSLLTTTYHNTPIVLMGSPQWSRGCCATIARYIFEKTKTPALCLIHSAIAAQYGLKWATMTVVDIGFEKVDITCIHDYQIVGESCLGYPNQFGDNYGGEAFTQKLMSLLKDKNFTHEMAEQLKKSPICEVLPYAPDADELMDLPTEDVTLPTIQTTSADPASAEATKVVEQPNSLTSLGGDIDDGMDEGLEADEGVLDVANIVTSGNTREFLAKKEREKAEKAKLKKQNKALEAESAAAKPIRLPNSKKKVNTFFYEELAHEDVEVPISSGAPQALPAATTNGDAPATNASIAEPATINQEAKPDSKLEGTGDAGGDAAEPATTATITERRTKRVRREIEIGLERFLFADRTDIDRITDTLYRTIQSIDERYQRQPCWDNIVFVGNGSRLRGLKENIMQTLLARHLISPSTATIFTSELPSNMATPTGTGSQTPTGSYTGQLPTTSSVNPLLQAATTASLGVPGAALASGSTSGEVVSGHHYHGQTPMSIKQCPLPTYLAEWNKNGYEEAQFLGSLICGRLAYCIHNADVQTQDAQRHMALTRVDYNELGPKAIRKYCVFPHL